jgi:hypothetical protein
MMWPLRLMGRRMQGVVECGGALVVTGRSGLAEDEPALSVHSLLMKLGELLRRVTCSKSSLRVTT